MDWTRVKESGAVESGGSKVVLYEVAEAEVSARGGWVDQAMEQRSERVYVDDVEPAARGEWVEQVLREARGSVDFCPEVAEEVADVVYHGGASRPVRRVAWSLCGDRPGRCEVLPEGWGPGADAVPTPTIFLQSNPPGALECLPLNRLERGRGPVPWIAHLRGQGEVVGDFAQGQELLMLGDFYGEGLVSTNLLTGLWSPADMATALWLDAADEETVEVNAEGRVMAWGDKSGNGVVVDQVSNLLRPTYEGAIEGVRALKFQGETQSLEARSYTKSPGFYIILVAQHDLGENRPAYSYFDSISGTERVNFRTFTERDSAQVLSRGVDEGDGRDLEAFTMSNISIGGDPLIFSVGNTGGGGSFINYNATQKIVSGTLGQERLLGLKIANASNSLWSLGGALGEFIVLDGVPDEETQRKLEGYLAHKWGIAGRIPSDHPYKVNPPTARVG